MSATNAEDLVAFLRPEHADIAQLALNWLRWDPDASTRAEMEALLKEKNTETLRARLATRIAFGTAGLRGPMRAGFDSMNQLTVLQASQGLCRYMQQKFSADELKRGVVIGCDARHNSRAFAEISARTFVSQGIPVHYFGREVVPTPFVSYGTTCCNALAGIMVTASHNPKQDNGYKVYWTNGAQIIPPHDSGIAAAIDANLEPWAEAKAAQLTAETAPDVTDRVADAYYAVVRERLCWHRATNATKVPPMVFTPMHGVGQKWVERAAVEFGLPAFIVVPEQQKPDPDFPTVAFPNPEEGKGALALAMAAAGRANARLIVANDPDSDRLAAAELKDDGSWHVFSGNELGILFAHWMWTNYRAQPGAVVADNCVMLNSTVSSKMLAAMAKAEGFRYRETLTGFKWMGNWGDEERAAGRRVLFAFEEAIGFMLDDICLDKDGVRAAVAWAEMCSVVGSPLAHLHSLHQKYGFHTTLNHYYFCYDPVTLAKIFGAMRADGKYPEKVGEFAVTRVRDLTAGVDTGEADRKPRLPVSKSSEMITFYFANGATVTLRGSGTEPKLKYYSEMAGPDADVVRATLTAVVDACIAELLRPDENGLKKPASS